MYLLLRFVLRFLQASQVSSVSFASESSQPANPILKQIYY